MMPEDKSSKFRFDASRPEPESFYREEIKDLRLEKLNNRVTFITILIPCLIGILLFFVYRDLTGRVNRTEDTGYQEVQKLSQRIDEKMTDLAAQYNTLAVSISEKLEGIDTRINGLQKDFHQNADALAKLDESKSDRSEQRKDIERIENALTPIKEELQTLNPIREELKALAPLREEIDSVDGLRRDMNALAAGSEELKSDLTDAIATFTRSFEQTNQKMIRLQQNFDTLSKSIQSKIDQEKLDLELLRMKKSYQLRLFEVVTKIEERLKSIESRLKAIERPAAVPRKLVPSSRPEQSSLSKQSKPIDEQDLSE